VAYQALYRKWRPMVFEDVIGQSHITETLGNEIISKKIAHAFLFCGTRGTGKTTAAKILSRAVNCISPKLGGNPCNECSSCRGIIKGTIMDVIEIDAASNNGVDDIRKLRDEVIYTPATTKYKVYIIDEVHMLSMGAFNALLKTLEEPPPHAIFILATTEPHKIPATIQSRCQRFDFRRISNHHIAGRIGEIAKKEGIEMSSDAIRLVASIGDGSMRDALSVLDLFIGKPGEITKSDVENLTGMAGNEIIFKIAGSLIDKDISSVILFTDEAIKAGRDITYFAEELLNFFRELLICKVSLASADILDKSDEELALLKSLSEKTTTEMLVHSIKVFSDAIYMCKWASNPKVILETSMIKICSPQLDTTSEAFAARLEKLESALMLGKGLKADTKNVVLQKQTESAAEQKEEPQKEQEMPDEWSQIINAVKKQDEAAAALLCNTECKIDDNAFYIIFKSAAIRDIASKDENIKNILSKKTQNRILRFVEQNELQGVENKSADKQPDPIDELLQKKNELGDQMTIF